MNKRIVYSRYTSDSDSSAQRKVMLMFEDIEGCKGTFIMSKAILLICYITEVLLVMITRAYISIHLDIPYSIGYNLI